MQLARNQMLLKVSSHLLKPQSKNTKGVYAVMFLSLGKNNVVNILKSQ